jgi:hypothetical protein
MIIILDNDVRHYTVTGVRFDWKAKTFSSMIVEFSSRSDQFENREITLPIELLREIVI